MSITKFPNSVLRNNFKEKLNPYEYFILLFLISFGSEVIISDSEISDLTKLSRKTIRKYKKTLIDKNILKQELIENKGFKYNFNIKENLEEEYGRNQFYENT